MPARCPTNANATILPRPRASQSGPPKSIARVNPQNAVPFTHPTCSWLRLNSFSHGPTAPALTAKHIAVTTRAIRLARKRRLAFMGGSSGLEAEFLEVLDAGRDIVNRVRRFVLDQVILDAVPASLGDDRRPIHRALPDDDIVRGGRLAFI